MARECCANCAYCEHKSKYDTHLGANETDWWCNLYAKWLHNADSKCSDYVPD